MADKIDLEQCNFRNSETLTLTLDLVISETVTLTLDLVIRHTAVHQLSTFIYIPNFTEIRKKLFMDRWMYGCTYLLTDISDPLDMLLGQLGGVDLS